MNKFLYTTLCLLGLASGLLAQDLAVEGPDAPEQYVYETFYSTRIINTHSVETLRKKQTDFRIGHRFGDLMGPAGGWATFYGLENAADIYTGIDYGITDDLLFSAARTKGGGPVGQLLHAGLKYRILKQTISARIPVSVTAWGLTTFASGPKSENPQALNAFPKFAHRFSYSGQLLIARKFASFLSLQVSPGFVYRNLVPFGDKNLLFHAGVGLRLKMSKIFNLIVDAQIPFDTERLEQAGDEQPGYHIPIGLGLEIDADGHLFQINLTNARGMVGTDYIPYTTSNWFEGEFRLGFTISRLFNK